MIQRTVSSDGVPTIEMSVAGQVFTAIIDTGFNGDLELPAALRDRLNPEYLGISTSALAAGQTVKEEVYRLEFPFDGRRRKAQVTFAPGAEILIGTHFLRDYHLEINFKSRSVILNHLSARPSRTK